MEDVKKTKTKNKKEERKIKSWILIAQILLAPLAMHRLLTFLLALINSHIYKTNKKTPQNYWTTECCL